MGRQTILADVSRAYSQSRDRYERAQYRGDTDRADEALAEMQQIESCVTVVEVNTSWRGIGERRRGRG